VDNDAYYELKHSIKGRYIDLQLVPPHTHRRNAAEHAIQTFKTYFTAGLCSTDKSFPMHLWYIILGKAILTLNMMRVLWVKPNILAVMHLQGQFYFNHTPLAPAGTRVVAREKPNQRRIWAPHDMDDWYAGPTMDHYRCYQVYITNTTSTILVDMVDPPPTCEHVSPFNIRISSTGIQIAHLHLARLITSCTRCACGR
jgi:hypothetical protein